jgi:dTDP-4-dehydrorhamnose 3,5-epimerase
MGRAICSADPRSPDLFVIFTQTKLSGAFILESEKLEDERGFFARTWCQREFEAYGLKPRLAQSSISFSKAKGTLRGMQYQVSPCEETKLVQCTSGAIYDVIIDLRLKSHTFKRYLAEILSAQNHRMLYVPEGFAHGFLTLEDNCEVFYQISEFYSPQHPGEFGGMMLRSGSSGPLFREACPSATEIIRISLRHDCHGRNEV